MQAERPEQAGDGPAWLNLLVTEYQVIKEEQKVRIGFRDNLLYVTLAAVTAVIVAAAQAKAPLLLLALPPVCVILGWTYLVNDEKISAIGRYVRTDLGPRLVTALDAEAANGTARTARTGRELFGWETAHRADARRGSRKLIQCLVDLSTFCLVPLAGLVLFWLGDDRGSAMLAASVAEALAIGVLGWQILVYAIPFGAGDGPGGDGGAGDGPGGDGGDPAGPGT
ncbi:hypothetical protein [Streptomyces showdoensis]|uniref:Integral membrane protein n=1 Tax=Streptomyces showdoensis TaxID=68268 RepID=A0A2P2GWH7_STREW|nr:hypothetical protein [Streptomyces showdoensis]KKZ75229.1 hypothetical protein VO63_03665 [Streptomyces showdoensis]